MLHAATHDRDLFSAYRHDLRRHRVLDADAQHALAVRYAETGDPALARRLACANLPLVIVIANQHRSARVPFVDLVQEGNLGLLRAVEKFDPHRGVRFSSYAALWIRAYVLRYIMSNWRLLRFGTTATERRLFFNLHKAQRHLDARGEPAGAAELAAHLRASEAEVVRTLQALDGREESMDALFTAADGERSWTMAGRLAAPDELRPDVRMEQAELAARLRTAFGEFERTLAPRERALLCERVLADAPRTLEEMGRRFGVSRERVRQLETRIIEQLRERLRKDLSLSEDGRTDSGHADCA